MNSTKINNMVSVKDLPLRVAALEREMARIREMVEESELFQEAFIRTRNETKISLNSIKKKYGL
jgi:hypothetical protein